MFVCPVCIRYNNFTIGVQVVPTNELNNENMDENRVGHRDENRVGHRDGNIDGDRNVSRDWDRKENRSNKRDENRDENGGGN